MDAVASEISLVERSSRCAIHIFTQTRFLEVTIYIAIEKALPIELKGNAFFYALFSLLSFLTNKTEIISTSGNTQPANIPF